MYVLLGGEHQCGIKSVLYEGTTEKQRPGSGMFAVGNIGVVVGRKHLFPLPVRGLIVKFEVE